MPCTLSAGVPGFSGVFQDEQAAVEGALRHMEKREATSQNPLSIPTLATYLSL